MTLPSARQQQILDWLHDEEPLTIEALVSRLGVSVMTVHRDLDALAQAGLAQKVRGGVRLQREQPPDPLTEPRCRLCHIVVRQRTAMTIQLVSGEQIHACCPHCGLLILAEYDTVQSVLTRDFLYGRVMNAGLAYFLLDADLSVCCLPGVYSFASRHDAERFQRGFGGRIVAFAEAQQAIVSGHQTACQHSHS